MTEELRLLWELHGLDEQLVTLSAALRRHPEERAALERRLADERVVLETFKKRIADLQLRHRQLEKDVEALTVEERKFQSQLPLVKKNEEYAALLHEIGGAKAKRSDRETELLVLMEEEQQLQGERPARERALAAIEAEIVGQRQRIDAAEAADRERAAALESERKRRLDGLAAGTRSRYERIRAGMEGRAVVPILKGACGGCFRGQPPQVLQEARRGERLLTCEGCGRLLIYPPDA